VSASPGGRLGAFSIERELGRGGMGIVYLARDPKLNRRVAIKVLPAHVAGDSGSLARFRREATLLAALNHPNIAAIYNIEEADGQQLLVLEYVPGPTLADVMADPGQTSNGRLPLAQALAIAAQIASALEAAHEQGIVHRDLKPANIKVRDDGTVKVLDFGLAKAPEPAGEGAAAEATMTSPALTEMGVILGTAAYMAPEQARGKTVDRRADLWAFGVVLYEMLTGERLFPGETMTDVLASVVTREPDWEKLPADTPASLRRLLRRCLEKDPRRRLRDAADARMEIEEAQSGPIETTIVTVAAPPSRSTSRSTWLVAAVLGATAIVAALAYALGSAGRDAPSVLRRLSVTVPGPPLADMLSPDGAWLVSRNNARLFVRRFDQSDWRELPGTRGAHFSIFWSSDSRYIAFAIGAALKKVDVEGARAQTICETCLGPDQMRGGAWSSESTLLVGGSWPGGLKKVSADGQVTELTTLNRARGENSHRFPAFLPDGRHFLFAVRRDNGEHEIQCGSIDGGDTRVVTPAFSRMVYRDGYLFFARGYSLLAQPLDPATCALSGTPATLVPNVRHTVTVGEAFFGVGADGTLVYPSARAFAGAAWVDRTGRYLGIAIPDEIDETLRISPDGRRIAAAVHDLDKASTDIVVFDVASGAKSRLTTHPLWDQNPVWSPDSKQVAYHGAKDEGGIYVQDAAGGNERLIAAGDSLRPLDWSVGGQILASRPAATGRELVLVPVSGGAAVRFTASSSALEGSARFSADGTLVAYQSLESGSSQIHIRSVDSSRTVRVTTAGGANPVWSRDGRELFYVDHEVRVTAVPVQRTGAGVELGPAKPLFPRSQSGSLTAAFDVDADGRFLLRPLDDDSRIGDRTVLNVIENWTKLIGR
jgi:serine/threonine protein kinase/Tol biopolymer transport system component